MVASGQLSDFAQRMMRKEEWQGLKWPLTEESRDYVCPLPRVNGNGSYELHSARTSGLFNSSQRTSKPFSCGYRGVKTQKQDKLYQHIIEVAHGLLVFIVTNSNETNKNIT
jgi:hypothetical protein